MSPFGKIFGKNKENPETEQDLSDDEDELPQSFQLESPAKEPEPALADTTGEATSEEQPDPLSTDEDASAAPEEQKQEENPESKEGDLMALFGTATHGGGELAALSGDIEDVPVQELLADLQSMAATLRRRSPPTEERREEAA
jgi:hypothetical protein